jgi:acyl-CoA reductase-like NAD-dependent aldehyde dehydrogenase
MGSEQTTEFTHTIDGRAEGSRQSFEVINPATAKPFARSPDASKEQLDRAISAARRAFGPWSRLSFAERRKILAGFGAALRKDVDQIAPVLVREQGKPLAVARAEVMGTAHHLEAMCEAEVKPEVLRNDGKNRIELHYRPMGVVGAITPWNVPLVLASHKIAHGLYAGNTMVLKPSPYTPLATLLMGRAVIETLPPGVLNIVAGGNDLGQWMTEHPDIDRITFTGSVATGKRVMASAAGSLKRVSLELGGNDPAIVLEDADLERTTAGLFRGAFFLSGQVCMAVKRVYVPRRLYAPLVERLVARARAHKVGDGFEQGVEMGPMQNKMQFDKVVHLLEETKRDRRAEIVVGGSPLDRPGYFIPPTVVASAKDDMRLVVEEQFGPVLPVLEYTDVSEAIERANATRFGLCASVWTRDLARGAQVAGQLQAGTAWVNHHLESLPDIPFGGFKESGVGRELGYLGLTSYMEAQVINVPAS